MIRVTIRNLDKIKKNLDDYRKRLDEKRKELLERLFEEGIDIATVKIGHIVADGTNGWDITTSSTPEWISDNKLALSVIGDEITFIEFGTGTHYTEQHPQAAEFGFERGTYGKGKGMNPPWWFMDRRTGEWILTKGNPPNRIVYDTAKELRERVQEIAAEVYGND